MKGMGALLANNGAGRQGRCWFRECAATPNHPPLTQRLDSVAKRVRGYQQQCFTARARIDSSAQEYVCSADHLDRPVVADEPQRSVGVEPAEAAADGLILGDVDGELGPAAMSALLP